MLDPTRVTLFIGNTGMNGYEFREKILMERFGIQINKTSINSVLLIFTIGVTWSSVHFLLDALRRVAADLERERAHRQQGRPRTSAAPRSRRSPTICRRCPTSATSTPRSGPTAPPPFGDMRAAFYAGYEEADREHVLLGAAGRRLADGKTLVSTTFVVPYPPGFPVLVPGQVVSKEILYFLAQLDVKEIHGYHPDLGLSVFTEAALARLASARPAAGAADAAMKPSPASASPRPDRNSSSTEIQVAGRSQAT